jgi:hypothetical protein
MSGVDVGDNDEVDLVRSHTGSRQGVARRLHPKVAGIDPLLGKMPRPDPGALPDPVVRRLDSLLGQSRHQFSIRHPARGQITACAGDAGKAFHLLH